MLDVIHCILINMNDASFLPVNLANRDLFVPILPKCVLDKMTGCKIEWRTYLVLLPLPRGFLEELWAGEAHFLGHI